MKRPQYKQFLTQNIMDTLARLNELTIWLRDKAHHCNNEEERDMNAVEHEILLYGFLNTRTLIEQDEATGLYHAPREVLKCKECEGTGGITFDNPDGPFCNACKGYGCIKVTKSFVLSNGFMAHETDEQDLQRVIALYKKDSHHGYFFVKDMKRNIKTEYLKKDDIWSESKSSMI